MQAQKFQFNTTFDDEFLEAQRIAEEIVVEDEPPPPPTFSEEEMASCRQQAYAEGHAAGQSEAESGIKQVASAALQGINAELGNLATTQNAMAEECRRDAISLAAVIVRKTVPAIAHDAAASAIESFVRDCFPQIMEEPRIVVRIADAMLDQVKEDLEQIAEQSGFPGQMIVLSDAELSTQDCRVEWADGGAERDSDRIWQEIDDRIERFLESLTPAAAMEPEITEDAEITETAETAEITEITEIPTPECVS